MIWFYQYPNYWFSVLASLVLIIVGFRVYRIRSRESGLIGSYIEGSSRKPLRILLIHPQHRIQRHGTGVYKKYLRYAPVTMPTLAALVPKDRDVQIQVIDEMVETIDFDLEADILGVTSITSTAPRAYEIAKHFKKKGAYTVMGGPHATLLTDEALENVDTVIRGYAETSWPQFIRDFQDQKQKRLYEGNLSPIRDVIVSPDRRFIKRSGYVACDTVEMSRGCSKRCDFCVTHHLHNAFVTKDIKQVINEIRSLPGRIVTFLDPNLIGNVAFAKEFFTELAKLNKYWAGSVSIDVLEHPELLDLMVKSGGRGFLIGFESLDQAALDSANKSFSKVSRYADAIATLHRKGIMVQGSFVFGFDVDTRDTFDQVLDFVVRAKIDLPQFTIYTPFPGTAAYTRLHKEGRILTKDWSRYNGHEVVFQPKNMSPQELFDGVSRVWAEAYSLPSIAKRLTDPPYLLKPITLLSNLNFRAFMRRVHIEEAGHIFRPEA